MEDGSIHLVLSYVDQEIALYLNDSRIVSLSLGTEQGWKAVALTWNTTIVSLSNNSSINSTSIPPKDFIANFGVVKIGRNLIGILQDVIIYNTPLQEFNLPSIAAFLPQCYCQGNVDSNEDCVEEDKIAAR